MLKRLAAIMKAHGYSWLESQQREQPPVFSQSRAYGQKSASQDEASFPPAGDKKKQQEAVYYGNLECSPGASFGEIKASYRRLVRRYHPDRFLDAPEKMQLAQEITARLNEAYAYFEQKYKM